VSRRAAALLRAQVAFRLDERAAGGADAHLQPPLAPDAAAAAAAEEAPASAPAARGGRVGYLASRRAAPAAPPVCRVPGCAQRPAARSLGARYRVCEQHLQCPEVLFDDGTQMRCAPASLRVRPACGLPPVTVASVSRAPRTRGGVRAQLLPEVQHV
jgi:hypothetical protein